MLQADIRTRTARPIAEDPMESAFKAHRAFQQFSAFGDHRFIARCWSGVSRIAAGRTCLFQSAVSGRAGSLRWTKERQNIICNSRRNKIPHLALQDLGGFSAMRPNKRGLPSSSS